MSGALHGSCCQTALITLHSDSVRSTRFLAIMPVFAGTVSTLVKNVKPNLYRCKETCPADPRPVSRVKARFSSGLPGEAPAAGGLVAPAHRGVWPAEPPK